MFDPGWIRPDKPIYVDDDDGTYRVGDWVIGTVVLEELFEPCGARTEIESLRYDPATDSYVAEGFQPGICLARPNHEHPHVACDALFGVPLFRVGSVGRRSKIALKTDIEGLT